MATNAQRPSLGLAACTAIVVGNIVGAGDGIGDGPSVRSAGLCDGLHDARQPGDDDRRDCVRLLRACRRIDSRRRGAARGVLPRIGAIEVVAFLFSIFTVYGCGPTPVLYGLLLLLFGIPVYVWQQREHAKAVAAHRLR